MILRSRHLLVSFTGLFLLYVAGIVVRYQFGIAVVIRNDSGEPLREVTIKVEYRGKSHSIGDLAPGEVRRVFVQPVGESHINLTFKDAKNVPHIEMLAGYVEDGNCGSTRARVTPGPAVQVVEDTFRLFYWKSWLEFP